MKKEPNAAPTPTVAADAAAPSDTCSCGYSLETSCNVLDPTCKRNAAQPDERTAFESAQDLTMAAFHREVDKQFARATAPQATVKGDEREGALYDPVIGGVANSADAARSAVPQAVALTDEQIRGIWLKANGMVYRRDSLNDRQSIAFARALLAEQVEK